MGFLVDTLGSYWTVDRIKMVTLVRRAEISLGNFSPKKSQSVFNWTWDYILYFSYLYKSVGSVFIMCVTINSTIRSEKKFNTRERELPLKRQFFSLFTPPQETST